MLGSVGLLTFAAFSPAAWAQDEDALPSGQIGFSLGVRQGVGDLADDFGLGAMGAVHGGFHPTQLDRSFSFGLHWSVAWAWFGFDDQASVSGSLKLLEFNFGARVRRILGGGVPRFLTVGGGLTILRSNVPIAPDFERLYWGPHGSLGVEQFITDSVMVSFEVHYGLIVNGPGGVSVALGISFGR